MFLGSYWNEADYYDYEWQESFWGVRNVEVGISSSHFMTQDKYPALLEVKRKYDPRGLFICHHCVGSEEWTADGNCRLPPVTPA